MKPSRLKEAGYLPRRPSRLSFNNNLQVCRNSVIDPVEQALPTHQSLSPPPESVDQFAHLRALVLMFRHEILDPLYAVLTPDFVDTIRSEEHTSELQSLRHLVCRLLLA